jgi:FlaA1/EpsC-like NDP-sugar epimerase
MTTFLLKLRNRHFFALDLAALVVIPALALALRLDGFQELPRYAGALLVFTLIGLVLRLLVFWRAGLYGRYWRYASVDEIALIVLAVAAATTINTLLFFTLRLLPPCSSAPQFLCTPAPLLPRSMPLIDGMLILIAVGGIRFSVRMVERWRQRGHPGGKRVLIIGAGDAGRMIVREMQANPQLGLEPVGFIDDDPTKQGVKIQGLPVLGDRERIPEVVRDYKLSQAIIAMPTAPGKTIRRFVELCEEAGVEAKTIPGIYEMLSGQVSVNQIRDVDIEDLLRREPVEIEADEVARMVRGKRVLVTGAGGSIGLEICRQVAQHGAAELVLLGHGENSIFRAMRDLTAEHPDVTLHPVIADIRDRPRLEAVFRHQQPCIVFHAAAHKHVPIMECNVEEAISNNVLGTQCLIGVAEDTGVERFVLISTDKAVNPCSVMGATKRVAELLVEAAAERNGRIFVAVRFGNVLGSRGSVSCIFREQIARGGPVTVTHPDMRRYFMTIPEAVQLVLQAAAIGQGGEVFVLDMGEPVAIVDLAHDLIRLSGLEVGRDIDIKFIGTRPGEKLFEELFAEGEVYQRTHHEKIFVCSNSAEEYHFSRLTSQVDALIAAAEEGNPDEVRRLLKVLVPEYQPGMGG